MRVFTDIEQVLIRRLNTQHGFNLYTLIDPWIEGVSFDIDRRNNKVVFNFEMSSGLDLARIVERNQEIQSVLIQSVNLIKLFEEKGYLFTYISASVLPETFVWGRAAVNMPSIQHDFIDPRISELIVKYSTQEIFVTPELGKFIQDNFRTREELRANRQFYTTLIALIVASVAFLTNLGFSIYNATKGGNSKNDVEFQNEYYQNYNDKCEFHGTHHCHCSH